MRDFNELTNAEILALSEREIETYIDLACAEQGAPFLPPEPVEPVKPSIQSDLTVFKIGGLLIGGSDIATQILALLADTTVYEDTYLTYAVSLKAPRPIGHDHYAYPKIESIAAITPTTHETVKQALEVYTAAKKKYDEEKKEYDRAISLRSGISEEIRERVYVAQADRDLRKRLRDDFGRYLKLADGNAEIAARFFAKAYSQYDLDGEYADIRESAAMSAA